MLWQTQILVQILKNPTVLYYMYNLIWSYFLQSRSQWQLHTKEFAIILYCETANFLFGEDASKVSTGRQQVVTGLTNISLLHVTLHQHCILSTLYKKDVVFLSELEKFYMPKYINSAFCVTLL